MKRLTSCGNTPTAPKSSSGSADAWADPLIYIDPVFLAANPGYVVTLSSGVANAVPAPGALWLLVTAVAGLAIRRRKRSF